MSFLPLLLSRTHSVVRPGIESSELLIRSMSCKHLLLMLPLIEFVEFELRGWLLGELGSIGRTMRVDNKTTSSSNRLVVAPMTLTNIFVHCNK